MKKLIKIILALIMVMILFAISSAYLLTKLVEPSVFKEQLIKTVHLKTGRQLTINGEVRLSIFPWLGVIANDIALDNAPYFSDKKFATASKITVQVKVLPLFARKVVVSKFAFKNLMLNVERDDSGINNWDDLHDSFNRADSKEKDGEVQQEAPLSMLYFSNVDIDNAIINLEDQRARKYLILNIAHLNSEGINFHGSSFVLNAAGALKSGAGAKDKNFVSNFIFTGNMLLDWPNKMYAIAGLKSTGDIVGGQLKEKINFSVNADIDSDLSKQEAAVNNLRLQLANLVAIGQVHVTNIIYAPDVVGDIDIASFDPKPLLLAFGVIKEDKAADSVWQSAALKFSMQTTSKFLKVPNLELSLNGTTISGNASYSHFNDKLVVFSFDVDRLDLDRYGVSASTASPSVSSPTVAAAAAITTAPSAKVEKVDVNSGVVQNDTNEKSKNSNKNKKKRVRKSVGNKTIAQPANEESAGWLYATLRTVMLNGDMHIDDLQLAGTRFSNVKMEVEGNMGNINISPLASSFYRGTLSGAINIDVRKDVPLFAFNGKISNIEMQQFLRGFIGNDKFSGIGNATLKLVAMGEKAKDLLKHLSGNVNVSISKGSFYGIDIAYQIEKVKMLINGAQESIKIQETVPPKTSFSQLQGSFNIFNGVANTNDLVLQAPQFKIKGKGAIDIAASNLDMQLDATYADRADFYVPIKVTGSFSAPIIKPDVAVFMGRLLKGAVVEKLNKQLSKELQKGKFDTNQIIKSIKKIDDKSIRQLLSQ